MVVYRITRRDSEGKKVVCEVLLEEERYRCRYRDRAVPGCEGHDSLREALVAHLELSLVGEGDESSIECSELPDYLVLPLLVPEGLPSVTVNGYGWGWARRRDTVVACLDNGVWDRPDREENWMVAVWDTRPEYPQQWVDRDGEGRETLDRLGDFYAVGSYLQSENGPEATADFHCEDPAHAIAHLLGLSAIGNKLSWVQAPALVGDDQAVKRALGESVLGKRRRAHVVWVNRELWEWPLTGGIRRRRPRVDRPPHPLSPKIRDVMPKRILIGRGADEEWVSIRPADRWDLWDRRGTTLEGYRTAWVVSLPPIPVGQAVDPLAYEQLLEAAFKWPQAGFGDAQPPYARLRFSNGRVGYGVVLHQREEAVLLAAAFGFPFVYYLDASQLVVTCGAWSARSGVRASDADPPEDHTFMVQMIGWYW